MTLPINAIQSDFLNTIKTHNVIVHAPTGSGKSTCLPVWAKCAGRVLVVQPRRIAATSLAQYLAEQSEQKLGQDIGYAIRFEAQLSEQTQVVFATPGVALRWLFENNLEDYDVVMLDEFHERRWDTDLLLALLKYHNKHRLIVTSATLQNAAIASYIDARTLHSEGRTYAIRSHYFANNTQTLPSRDDLASRVEQACEYALAHTNKDILVFLPGRAEINQCISACRHLHAQCVPLHGASPVHEQRQAMQQGTMRRIIFATNVAETSLTVPGIECVIDSGLERRTHLRKGKTVLGLDAIAQDSQQQRRGRCGRTAPGLYIALFGEHAPLLATTPVEIEREALDELVLASACAGIKIESLALLTPLPASSLVRAIEKLTRIKAINENGLATDLGRKIYPLPVDAQLGYLIEAMPSSVLRQAMIDLASVITTPAQLFTGIAQDDLAALAKENGEHLLHSDIALSIAAIRGQCDEYLSIDTTALEEARNYSNYLRDIFQLPQITKSARFNHQALLEAIAQALPETIFVRRNNRRGGFGNGSIEVSAAKQSLLPEDAEAALVLASFSLAGKGKKHAQTLATLNAPISYATVLNHATIEPSMTHCYVQENLATHSLEIRAQFSNAYAGVTLSTTDALVENADLIDALVELICRDELFTGVAARLEHELAYHQLYLRYHGQEQEVPSLATLIRTTLNDLGVQSQDDIALIEADDFSYEGIPDWQAQDFIDRYPLTVALPSMTLNIEYLFKAKRVIAHYASGERKDPPKRWELPTWQGLQIRYKKASKVVDIR